MKPLYILLVALFFSLSYCDEEDETAGCAFYSGSNGVEDCNSRKLPDGSTYYRCCFVEIEDEGSELKTCIPLTKEQYDDIDGTIKSLKKQGDYDDIEIDCESNYIILSLLSLILFLL